MKKLLVILAVMLSVSACNAEENGSFVTSFEEYEKGELKVFETDFGTWTADAGHAEIDNHHKDGKQGLHIFGGKKRTVEFAPNLKGSRVTEMSFWAERWTGREPFEFRIFAKTNSGWGEIYNGDKEIKVGRSFLNHVKIQLGDDKIDKFRFICTSPEDSGILIDDFCLSEPMPMELVGVTCIQQAGPALIRKEANEILRIKVDVKGELNPIDVTSLTITPDGSTLLDDIESAEVYYSGHDGSFSNKTQFSISHKAASRMVFDGCQTLTAGSNNFWVSYKLKDTADLMHKVDAGCLSVGIKKTDGTETVKPTVTSPPIKKRIGYNIRNGGDDGVSGYRIPGLATTNKGTLIAVYDIRRHGMRDLPGDIDVGMSRSTDKGQSWEPMKVIMDMGEPQKENGIGDPSVLVDRANNTIWVAALWSRGNRAWNGSQPGMTPDETGQLVLVKSEDDGVTWSSPINITEQVKNPKWHLLLQGPGNGITLRNGTLVFPAQFKDENNMPHSTIIYSKDHGTTWAIGTGAKSNTTEAQVVELNDGSLMLNMRDNRGGSRSVYTTKDMGKTWQEHPSSRSALPEPVCMASIIRFSSVKDGDKRDVLLFSNPATNRGRYNMTIKASMDEGATWPSKYHKLYHEPNCAGYSCLTKIDDETAGVLYEGGNTALLVFEKFSIDEIMPE